MCERGISQVIEDTLSRLLVAFIWLRVAGMIEWDWVWVLAPAWIPVAVVVLLIVAGKIAGIELVEVDDDEDDKNGEG